MVNGCGKGTGRQLSNDYTNGFAVSVSLQAALSIYMDVINLFLNILRLVGAASSNDNS